MERLLKVPEVAARLGVSKATVYAMTSLSPDADNPQIDYVRVGPSGATVRIRESALQAYMERQTVRRKEK